MGVDAHVFKNMIISFTKGKLSKISEIKELGDKFYEIMEKYVPYYKEVIDNANIPETDLVKDFLDKKVEDKSYEIIDKVKLVSSSNEIDKNIIIFISKRFFIYILIQIYSEYVAVYFL